MHTLALTPSSPHTHTHTHAHTHETRTKEHTNIISMHASSDTFSPLSLSNPLSTTNHYSWPTFARFQRFRRCVIKKQSAASAWAEERFKPAQLKERSTSCGPVSYANVLRTHLVSIQHEFFHILQTHVQLVSHHGENVLMAPIQPCTLRLSQLLVSRLNDKIIKAPGTNA